MQVIEIKNDLAQVRYNAEEHAFSIGDFLVISDSNADILSQIIHLETDDDNAICLTKFILNINNDQTTSLYNGYMPSLDSTVSPVTKQEISDFITPIANGINLGYLINSNLPVQLSSTILETPLYIQSDYLPACTKLVALLLNQNQIERNILLYDLEGTFSTLNVAKYDLGESFKVPLNEFFIDFIYNNDLNELEVAQKALVQDILLEIKDYIKTTDKSYLEFSTLLDVVNEQYNEQPSDALILFRNKLIEYKQLGYFVENDEEYVACSNVINSPLALFNAYKLKQNWQKALFEFLTASVSEKTQLIAQISNTSVDELSLNNILAEKNIYPIFITNYSSQYRNLLRSKIPNMIFFQSIDHVPDFPLYSNFLNILFDNNYIVWGEITSYLSILSSFTPVLSSLTTSMQSLETQNKVEEDEKEVEIDKLEENMVVEPAELTSNQETDLDELVFDLENSEDVISDEFQTENVSDEIIENDIVEDEVHETSDDTIFDELNEDNLESNVSLVTEDIVDEIDSVNDVSGEQFDISEEISKADEIVITESVDEFDNPNQDIDDNDLDFVQLDEIDKNLEDENSESKSDNEYVQDNIVEEFDSVDVLADENVENVQDVDLNELSDENFDVISDDDIVLNSDFEEISEEVENVLSEEDLQEFADNSSEGFDEENTEELIENNFEDSVDNSQNFDDEYFEEVIEDYSTNQLDETDEYVEQEKVQEEPIEEIYPQEEYEPIEEPKFQMPVYSSEPEEQEQQLGFVEGNIVYHEKYGRGIIEKVITYGAKTLCSIQFDNIGRRLLDPTLADLKHV